jgi:hypothetical protein|tara:strand:+ start:921 stop:2033 length:1113 start_codon:yes stop_codon:yes gene_type:complete
MNEFRDQLVRSAESIMRAAPNCKNEEGTKQFMVLPFLASLGYNPFNPDEVVPEHHADFSEKYKNRVDYAIIRDGTPIIAIEVKQQDAKLNDDRGQLRSYFNACQTVKLGILTNGIIYECFADTDERNIMDQTPFLSFSIDDIVNGQVDDRTINGIADLRRDKFDPANVGAEARRKLLLATFIEVLQNWQRNPSDDLGRLLLEEGGFKGVKTKKIALEAQELAKQAFSTFVERAILKRIGIKQEEQDDTPQIKTTDSDNRNDKSTIDDGIVTTVSELAAYDYAIRRLAFLVKDEDMFNAISEIAYKDRKTVFCVYYKRPQAGSIFNLKERSDGSYHFVFPALDNQEINTTKLADIDASLLEAFQQRVTQGG